MQVVRGLSGVAQAAGKAGGCPFHRARSAGAATAAMLDAGAPSVIDAGLGGTKAAREAPTGAWNERVAVRDSLRGLFAPVARDIIDGARLLDDVPVSKIPLIPSKNEALIGVTGAVERNGMLYSSPGVSPLTDLRGRLTSDIDDRVRSVERFIARQPVATSAGGGTHVKAAIGDYGEELSEALVRAGAALQAVADREMSTTAARFLRKGSPQTKLLDGWTFQHDARLSTIEGISTYVNTTALLTSRRIPGMSADDVLRGLEDGIALEQAATAPAGLWGLLTMYGHAPLEPLARQANGSLRLSASTRSLVKAVHAQRQQRGLQAKTTGLGCPIVRSSEANTSAQSRPIAELGREYIRLARRYLAESALPDA